ncbi:hypothetical protein PR003_g17930 [Phytophthora rubi]|uniref:Uncharacterized protein n=1 Tax=Phytophthora rubi TaxID=129364 RepID=A0A6A4E4J2_9STRA|nr:hypothetical protein PR003_g17930 [Phytophthora rubi]
MTPPFRSPRRLAALLAVLCESDEGRALRARNKHRRPPSLRSAAFWPMGCRLRCARQRYLCPMKVVECIFRPIGIRSVTDGQHAALIDALDRLAERRPLRGRWLCGSSQLASLLRWCPAFASLRRVI